MKVTTPSSGRLEMKPLDFDKNPALKYDFESKSGEDFKEFIKGQNGRRAWAY